MREGEWAGYFFFFGLGAMIWLMADLRAIFVGLSCSLTHPFPLQLGQSPLKGEGLSKKSRAMPSPSHSSHFAFIFIPLCCRRYIHSP